ncbi:MAG TPA: ABC transporter permease [Candidatus Limnocylindrales bacterium]|nr:ABC transporter permease [Candidatus Limnocylindrales bacterium]
MRPLIRLTIANLRSFLRSRLAMFWTLAFPLIFIFLFGFIFQGSQFDVKLGWVDEDGSAASATLEQAFERSGVAKLTEDSRSDALALMRNGKVEAVVVVPHGYGAAVEAGAHVDVTLYTDAAQQQASQSVRQVVGNIVGVVALGGRQPIVAVAEQPVQTNDLNFISYFVPSMLGLSLMQSGLFAAIPLVADREKLILKRLAATPLRRWQLVGSNVLMRLLLALAQAVVIVGVGVAFFGVRVTGNLAVIGGFIVLGSVTFLAIGYLVASFARTEDEANGMVSVLQFPMMFLSGTFFVLDQMPDFMQGIARVIPLTYLSDALRQAMVDGTAISPLWLCGVVLAGWLVVCFGIAARNFRWQ